MSLCGRRSSCFVIPIGALHFLLSPAFLFGQNVKPLSVEDALKTTSLGEVSPIALSPDGKWLAYMAQEKQRIVEVTDDESKEYVRTGIHTRNRAGNIWVANAESTEIRDLTGNQGSNWDPTWSPDGRYLGFVSDRDGSGQARLWVWDSVNDKLKRVSDTNVRAWLGFNRMKWTPDSRKIWITTIPAGLSVPDYLLKLEGTTRNSNAAVTPGATPTVFTSNPAIAGEVASVYLGNVYLHDLVLMDVETGKVTTVVTGRLIKWFEPSPDGRHVAYTTMKEFGRKQRCNLVTVDLQNMREELLVSDVRLDSFSWSPDGKQIAYGAYQGETEDYDYFIVDMDGGPPRKVSALSHGPSGCCEKGNPMWEAKGANFYFIHEGAFWKTSVETGKTVELSRIPGHTMRFRVWQGEGRVWTTDEGRSTTVLAYDDEQKQDGFYKVDLETGRTTKLLEDGECYSCKWMFDAEGYSAAASNNGRIAYVAEDGRHAPELWLAKDGFANRRRVTHLNLQLGGYEFGTAQLVEWLSGDGERLHGALLLPPRYEAGKRYPLIVWSYPGSLRSHYFNNFGFSEFPGPFNAQLFATRGYAVLYADAPWKKDEQAISLVKTVLPGVNKVIEMGIGDPERVGVMGHSGGGYSTLSLITQTKRFKAAVEVSGYGDLVGSYGMMRSDGSASLYMTVETLLGEGGPWQNPRTFVESSPIFHLDRITTPLLILHGSKDGDVASFLGDEMFVDLRKLGKRVEYARYENEAHVPSDWSYADQYDAATRVLAWFDKYLRAAPQ